MQNKVNEDVTRKIAHLARLKLGEGEIAQYTQELGKILEFVAQLGQVDTKGVEAVVHGMPLAPHFRPDEAVVLPEDETKRIVACAEQSLYDQYRVPQVIGGEA